MREDFRQSIRMESAYRRGDPIILRYELTNVGDVEYSLLVWETPLEREVFNFAEVRLGERPVPYDGRMVKRGDPPPEAYRAIAPGETITEVHDLSQSYAFEQPGTYTVTIHTRFLDVVPNPGRIRLTRARREHEPLLLDPVSVTFELLPDGERKPTSGERARRRDRETDDFDRKDLKRNLLQPRMTIDEKLRKELHTMDFLFPEIPSSTWDVFYADWNALAWTNASIAELAGWTGRVDNALYTEWFGSDDVSRYQTLINHYTAIRNKLLRPHTYNTTPDDCSPGDYAYTHPGSDTVYLCGGFFSAPATGTDSKFGTIIHEWSHADAGTDDIIYGQTGARNLASTRPQDAIRNADNHEYFSETLADRMLTAGVVWPNGKAYLFTAGRYFRYDIAADRVDPGYPLPIAGNWPGLWPDRVDAGVVWPNGKAYFFKDENYVRYDIATDRVDPGYPLSIGQHWPGLGGAKIDAGVVWNNGKAYFFRGNQYWRYDIASDRVDPGYPKLILNNWPGLWGDGITSAMVWPNGKAYILRGWQYARYDLAADRVDGGYPKAIAESWPFLWWDRIDAAIFWPNGKAYFFRDSQYMRYDNPSDRVDPGYPKAINGNWPGLGGQKVDAAILWPNNKAYIFRGSQYWQYDVATDKVDPGYPRSTASDWSGLGSQAIDAAIVWPNGKAYFFRGSQYWRYDIAARRVDSGYPIPIADGWPGLGSQAIDSAIMWPNGKAYFFRGSSYWRYDVASDRTDPAYPCPIGWNWPWLPGRVR